MKSLGAEVRKDYIRGHIEQDERGCWVWQLYLDADGYGRCRSKYGSTLAHRAAWIAFRGPIEPTSLTVDHLCRNRACVNPDHLELVTHYENMLRGMAARTHCSNGHEYTPENTYVRSGTRKRICRACSRQNSRRYKAQKLAVLV